MRRITSAGVALALAALVVVLTASGGSSGRGGYRVDAVMDNSAFLSKGQDVKVAGAPVGRVTGFGLTEDNKAIVEMQVDKRFAPFHRGASCTVAPQSLIGERFVECTTGKPEAPDLAPRAHGGTPTVPLADTSAPVDLDLLLSTYRQPVRQRLSLLLAGLGAGLAGRGADLNATLRRANPALGETRRVVNILDGDRGRLRELVGESDRILAALAARKRRVGEFVADTADFTSITAERRRDLAATIRQLPPLLREARPALASVSELARQGTPLTKDLQRSAAPIERVTDQIPSFSAAARPALSRLGETAETRGTPAVKALAPQLTRLRTFSATGRPTAALARQLLDSFRQTGTFEGIQQFVYTATLATARFDSTSHTLGAYPIFTGCEIYATTPTQNCDSHLSSAGFPTRPDDDSDAASRSVARGGPSPGRRSTPRRSGDRAPAPQTSPAPSPAAPAPSQPAPSAPSAPGGSTTSPSSPSAPQSSPSPDPVTGPVKGLLDYLLR